MKKIYLLLISTLFFATSSVAQDLQIDVEVPTSGEQRFAICDGERIVKVRVENITGSSSTAITLTGHVMTVDLSSAPGFKATGTVNMVSGNAVTVNDINTPSFNLPDLADGEVVEFEIGMEIDCGSLPLVLAGARLNLPFDFTYTGGNGSQRELSEDFEMVKPALSLPGGKGNFDATRNVFDAGYHVTDSITIDVVNAGNGPLSEFTYWVIDHPELTLTDVKIGNTSLVNIATIGDTMFYAVPTAVLTNATQNTGSPTNDPNKFQFNEKLEVKEIYFVDDCTVNPDDIQRGARYGCDGTQVPYCEQTEGRSGVRYGFLRPNVFVRPYYGFGLYAPAGESETPIHGVYLTNNGRVEAVNMHLPIQFQSTTTVGVGGLDTNSIYVQKRPASTGVLGPLEQITDFNMVYTSTSGCNPTNTMAYRVDIAFEEKYNLMPGDSLYIRFEQVVECQQACNDASCSVTNNYRPVTGGVSAAISYYEDPCELDSYYINWTATPGQTHRIDRFTEMPLMINGSEVVTHNSTLTYFLMHKMALDGTVYTDGSAEKNQNVLDYSKKRMQLVYINDPGVDWNGDTESFKWFDTKGNLWEPDYYQYRDNGINGPDTLIVSYTNKWPDEFTPGGNNTIKVKYRGDCTEAPPCVQEVRVDISNEIWFTGDSTDTGCANDIRVTCLDESYTFLKCEPTCGPGVGCVGLSTQSFNVDRVSFEQPDNDNNYQPDDTGTINEELVALNRIISGDTVKVRYRGVFSTNATHPQWENAYSVVQLPTDLDLTFTPVGASLIITDKNASGTTVGTYTSDVLQQYPQGTQVITDISPANTADLSSTNIPSGFTYSNGDIVEVEVLLTITDSTFNIHGQAGTVYYEINIDEVSFASHVEIDQTNSPNVGSDDQNDRYRCSFGRARFYYVEQLHFLGGGNANAVGGCTRNTNGSFGGGFFIGSLYTDFFPFEYRTPKGGIKTHKTYIEPGLKYDRFYWGLYAKGFSGSGWTRPFPVGEVPLNSGNYGNGLVGSSQSSIGQVGTLPMDSQYLQIVGDTVTFFAEQFMKDNFGGILADEGYYYVMWPYWKGSCTAPTGRFTQYVWSEYEVDSKRFGYNELVGNRFVYNPTDDRYAKKDVWPLAYSYNGGPEFQLQSDFKEQILLGSEACFDIDLLNTSEYDSDLSWMAFSNISGGINVKSLQEVNPATGEVMGSLIPQEGDIFQIGSMPKSSGGTISSRRFRLCVYTDNCERDSIEVNTGWDCDVYPKTLEEAACGNSLMLYTIPTAAELGMIIEEPLVNETADLCEEHTYVVRLSASILGSIKDVNMQIEFPTGMKYIDDSFEYLYPSPGSGSYLDAAPTNWLPTGNPENTFGNYYEINVTDQGHPILSTTGMPGTTEIGKNFMWVRFKARTDCNFISGSTVNFLSWAFDACDKLTNYTFSPSKSLSINGAPEVYKTQAEIDAVSLNPCLGESTTASASFSILQGSPVTTGFDSVRVVLPPGMRFTQMAASNSSQLSSPEVQNENGQEVIYWAIAAGLTGGTDVDWSFELESFDAAQICSRPYDIVVQTFRNIPAVCGAVTCSIRSLSSEARSTVTFNKPTVSIVSFDASSKAMPPGQEELSYELTIRNDGEPIPAGAATNIGIYWDVDGDGDVTDADSLIYTVTRTMAIADGQEVTIEGTGLVNAGTTCALIALIDPEAMCTCERLESFVVRPKLDIPFGVTELTVCSDEESQSFGPEALDDHSYEWYAPVGSTAVGIPDINVTPTTYTLTNPTTQNLVNTLVLRTERNNSCFVYDTVTVTVFPKHIDEVEFTVCQSIDFTLAAPTGGSNYQWAPTTNLADANNPQTTVQGGVQANATYVLTYLDANGCPATYTAIINSTACGMTSIGDTVFRDYNANGIQDITEPGEESVTVNLYAGGDTQNPISTTTTDENGAYNFENIPQGYYRVGFVVPDGMVFSPANAGSDNDMDSDADSLSGFSDVVFVSNGVSITNIDAGVVCYEWGDAPDTYNTSAGTKGPKHLIVPGLKLGTLIDAETDAANPATTGNNAVGDDADGSDDEDGVAQFATISNISTSYQVTLNATNELSEDAKLIGWIDFDGSGTFEEDEAAEITVPMNSTSTNFNLDFTVPDDITSGVTYARFRLTTDSEINTSKPDSSAINGEVEDYELEIVLARDWGDNPDTYQTNKDGDEGPNHVVVPYLFMGDTVDGELDADPVDTGDMAENDDDNESTNDEDGVVIEEYDQSTQSMKANVRVTNTGTEPANLIAWMDLNQDGQFQQNEAQMMQVPPGTVDQTMEMTFNFPSPPSNGDMIYSRFRLTTDPSITMSTPGGAASNGEVEDFSKMVSLCIKPDTGPDFTICLPKTTADLTDATALTRWLTTEQGVTISSTTGEITGLTTAGVYTFRLETIADPTCFDEIEVTVSEGDAPNVLCNDGSTSVTLNAPNNLSNVVWYSMDGTQVGTGTSLIVTSNTGGLQDGTEAYYYVGTDGANQGCDVSLCCPVKFLTQDCCPTPNCVGVTVIKN